MTNAGKELLNFLKSINKNETDVKCAIICHTRTCYGDSRPQDIIDKIDVSLGDEVMYDKVAILKVGWSIFDFSKFLKDLNFEYYGDDYGTQHLVGVVWFKDGSWLEREEYDCSESWSHKESPQIPNEIL